jgi:transposase-like protein
MNTVIMDVDVHMTCPACSKAQTQKLRWLEQNPTFKCEGCGKQFEKYGDQLLRVRHELNLLDESEKASKQFKINL